MIESRLTAPSDVYKRWCQFGLLSSHSRLHGSKSYRVPWTYDEEACEVLRKFTKLKCALMPYIYRQAVYTHEEGIPIMRPMFMEFPEERACEPLDKQYMLGDSLLVAPIFKEGGEVEYYLPRGKWWNILTNQEIQGGSWQKEHHDFMTLPLLVRQGSILAMGRCDQRPDYDYLENTEFLLYFPEEGMSATTEVTDLEGKIRMSVGAERKEGKIYITVSGYEGNSIFKVLGDEEIEIVRV